MVTDYEDVTAFTLDSERERELLDQAKECTFIWTNKSGEPVGVIMAFLADAKGHLWLTGAENRARFPAVRRNPQTCIVISSTGTPMKAGKTITYKGTSIIHDKADRTVKDWFYKAFARKIRGFKGEASVKQFVEFLDSPNRVVLEFIPDKRISHDGDKMTAATPPV